jgi:sorting nexin-13
VLVLPLYCTRTSCVCSFEASHKLSKSKVVTYTWTRALVFSSAIILRCKICRFINERIEALVLSRANKADKGVAGSEDVGTLKQREPPMPSVDELSALADHSSPGVELVRFSQGQSKTASDMQLSKTKSTSSVKPKSPNSCIINDSHPLESGSLPSSFHIYPDTGISAHPQTRGRITTESYEGQSA